MKFAVALSFVSLAVAGVLEPRACAGNNCNRAVTGTNPGLLPLSSRSADCASFLATTVTPAAVTTTVTVEETSTGAAKRDFLLVGRQVTMTASAVPSYASACTASGEYASACSCFGVTGTVTTVATPTVTVTTTVDVCDDL